MKKFIFVLFGIVLFLMLSACPAGESGFDISILYDTWQSQYLDNGYTVTYRWTFDDGIYSEYYSSDNGVDNLVRNITGSMSNQGNTVTIVKNTLEYNDVYIEYYDAIHSSASSIDSFDLDADIPYSWAVVRPELVEVEQSIAVINGSPITVTEAENIVDASRTQIFTFSVEGDTLTVHEDGETYVLTRM